jgi:hypothetical protein
VPKKLFYIRSHKHDQNDAKGNELALWWCPESEGYTYDLFKAGLYTKAEALAICGPFDQPIVNGKRQGDDQPSNIAYPVDMVEPLRTHAINKHDLENARLQAMAAKAPA